MDDKKFYEVFDAYVERFGEGFPTMQYQLTKKDAVKFMNRCLNENKRAQDIEQLRDDVEY